MMLTQVPSKLDNMLTLGLVALLALAVVIAIICKAVSKKKAATAPLAAPVEEIPEVPAATAPGAAGQLKLHDVEPKTAAMLMAIVADKLGRPVNELRFKSIKEVK